MLKDRPTFLALISGKDTHSTDFSLILGFFLIQFSGIQNRFTFLAFYTEFDAFLMFIWLINSNIRHFQQLTHINRLWRFLAILQYASKMHFFTRRRLKKFTKWRDFFTIIISPYFPQL